MVREIALRETVTGWLPEQHVTPIISKPTLVTVATMRNTTMVVMGEMGNVRVSNYVRYQISYAYCITKKHFDEHPSNLTRKFFH